MATQYYITGYPSLAAFIASDRDRTAGLFKRFDRLAARNLLYLQSELAELQAKQDEYDQTNKADLASKQSARNWHDFKQRAETDSAQLDLVKQIRSTLKEYRETLLFESTLASIPPPDRNTLKAFQYNFFNGPPGDVMSFPTLGGDSATLYDDANDLLVLKVPEQEDRLSMFVRTHFAFLFAEKSPKGGKSHVPTVGYASGRKISILISYISTILAAILLIGAIIVLYITRSPSVRLGLISLFTALFAASVGLLTNARRAEVFGATAAYAAVLVVFVSGNLSGPGGLGGG